ncbi:MAG: diguanylate cyclase [Magnetococcales bacterium]|nr:diguanylate cyclase [Magnetococcales bacterium]NGZ29277.1 diguanylate cyclase [Magnetococcales bacterium]
MQTISELSLEEIQTILDALERALRDHNQWLMAWHRSLICKIPPSANELQDNAHRRCNFGKWYYQQAHPVLKNFPVFVQMELVHATMHASAQALLIKSLQEDKLSIDEYDAFLSYRNEFREMVNKLETTLLSSLHDIDPLTRLLNRLSMIPKLRQVWEKGRHGETSILCMSDLDHFKIINDTYGHPAGDKVLVDVASFLSAHLRPNDLIFRYGGEEFLICLQNTTLTTGLKIVERVRETLVQQSIVLPDGQAIQVTCSFGMAPVSPEKPMEEVVNLADKALYTAKHAGRNQVVAWLDQDHYLSPHGVLSS